MTKKITLILALLILALIAFVSLLGTIKPQKVQITTQSKEYKAGDSLKINIKNYLKESICFSSCYPYYLEKKNGEWKSDIQYLACSSSDLAEKCTLTGVIKGFEIALSKEKKGTYRLAVPFCAGCSEGEQFFIDQWSYSGEFIIK